MRIKVLFSDVDGTLTDGRLYYSDRGEAMKVFHVHDGLGIKKFAAAGGIFAVITARRGAALEKRLQDLGVRHAACGCEDKAAWAENWLKENGFSLKEAAFIGDDENDLPLLQRVAISAAPADAVPAVAEKVSYHCLKKGGRGAVREFIEHLLTTP